MGRQFVLIYGITWFIVPCGMDVEKFSSYPEEREVLIPPGTLFRVTKVEKKIRIVEIEMTCLAVK